MAFQKLMSTFENKDYSKCMVEQSKMTLNIPPDVINHVDSSIFPDDHEAYFHWKISFYPHGEDGKDTSGYKHVYLQLIRKKIQIPVSVIVKFDLQRGTQSIQTKEEKYTYKKYERYGTHFTSNHCMLGYYGHNYVICVKVFAYSEATSSDFVSERKLLRNYSSLLENGAFSDLVICVKPEGIYYNVHRFILTSRSTVFSAMLSNNMQEKQTRRIEINDLSSSTIRSMLDFIYSCEVKFTSVQSTLELLEASEKYALIDLKGQCAEYLTAVVNENNTALILVHADRYNLSDLKATCLKYICTNKNKFTDKKQYQAVLDKSPHLLLDVILQLSKCR